MSRISVIVFVLCFSVLSGLGFAEEYYSSSFEEKNDLEFWATNGKYTVNYLGLSEEKSHSGKKSVKLDVTLESGTYCYFRIPVNVHIQPEKEYFLSGYLLPAQLPSGINVGLGWSKWCYYGIGGSKKIQGNRTIRTLSSSGEDWKFSGKEISRRMRADCNAQVPLGQTTSKIIMYSISVQLQGKFKGQRVVLYLDDVSLSSEAPERLAKRKERKVKIRDYPRVREVFVYGICGGVGATLGGLEKFPEPSWRGIPDYKTHYIKTVLQTVFMLHRGK